MTLKQMAALNVAKVIGGGIAIALIVNIAITYLGIAAVGIIGCTAMFIYCVKMVYEMEVDKLERLNSLTKIKETK